MNQGDLILWDNGGINIKLNGVQQVTLFIRYRLRGEGLYEDLIIKPSVTTVHLVAPKLTGKQDCLKLKN